MHIHFKDDGQKFIICDPQTSGGLLIAVDPEYAGEVEDLLSRHGLESQSIGMMENRSKTLVRVT